MDSWQAESSRQHANAWTPGRAILTDAGAHRVEHRRRIPIRARIDWADTGEQWLDTMALGWTGDLVYVDTWGTGHGLNACWLRAGDVCRR